MKAVLLLGILPPLREFGISTLLYAFLAYIIGKGAYQFIRLQKSERDGTLKSRSMVPLGAAALVFGFIGLFHQYINMFQALDANAVTPYYIRKMLADGARYPVLGLLCLAFSFIFKYINRR